MFRFGRKKTTTAYMIAAGISVVAVSFIPHGTNNTGKKKKRNQSHFDKKPSERLYLYGISQLRVQWLNWPARLLCDMFLWTWRCTTFNGLFHQFDIFDQ